MTTGRSLHLLKSVPKVLTRTCCLSTSYISVKVRTYRNSVKRMLGGCYNTPLLHIQGRIRTRIHARLSLAPVLLGNKPFEAS